MAAVCRFDCNHFIAKLPAKNIASYQLRINTKSLLSFTSFRGGGAVSPFLWQQLPGAARAEERLQGARHCPGVQANG